jgi:hypothetical protein
MEILTADFNQILTMTESKGFERHIFPEICRLLANILTIHSLKAGKGC